MHLSKFTDYSLRVLLYLAINNNQRATLREIADFYSVSFEHLRKVVHELSICGYLNTWQGRTGGMELARKPSEIRIGELIQHFEGHDGLIDCELLSCPFAGVCTLRRILAQGRQALFDTLNQYTLTDLVEGKPVMRKALQQKLHIT